MGNIMSPVNSSYIATAIRRKRVKKPAGKVTKPKKVRSHINDEHLVILQHAFYECNYLNNRGPELEYRLNNQLKLQTIKTWFRNQRFNEKKAITEQHNANITSQRNYNTGSSYGYHSVRQLDLFDRNQYSNNFYNSNLYNNYNGIVQPEVAMPHAFSHVSPDNCYGIVQPALIDYSEEAMAQAISHVPNKYNEILQTASADNSQAAMQYGTLSPYSDQYSQDSITSFSDQYSQDSVMPFSDQYSQNSIMPFSDQYFQDALFF